MEDDVQHTGNMRQRVQTMGTTNRPTPISFSYRRRTMSFPGFLPNGEVDSGLTGEAAKQAAEMLQNRKNNWFQLAGHKDTFTPAGPKTLWKKQEGKSTESKVYKDLESDVAKHCVPRFHREVSYEGSFYIEIEDLLQRFSDPNVIDIKMGTRTFLESEVSNPTLRKDLYEKMISLDPEAPTQLEQESRAVTKLRYMRLREDKSSSSNLGFRVDALRMSGQPPDCALKNIKSVQQVNQCLRKFLRGNTAVATTMFRRLQEIRASLEESTFFSNHEVIGSSILLLYDNTGQAGAWLIDFGKTRKVDMKIDHRTTWQQGNHEDGFLFGLDNLIHLFSQLPHESDELPDDPAVDLNSNTEPTP